jgi:uncharacterized ion transporter superfamily protein YfcC
LQTRAGIQITRKAFLQSALILLLLMLLAGALTMVLPAGRFERNIADGREKVEPGSYHLIARPDYPIWRWFTAPLEVLGGPDGLTIVVVGIFVFMVASGFAVMDRSGMIRAGLSRVVQAVGDRKYLLLLTVSFLFMTLGAFLGLFEEVVPLVPLMLALSFSLGWDSLVGLGMSILATNIGFSAAITNPFTIGIAQKLAGLPLFSGTSFRLLIFLVMYGLLAVFLVRYARLIERDPRRSPVFEQDQQERHKQTHELADMPEWSSPRPLIWFLVFLMLILSVLIAGPFVPALFDLSLPLVGLLFLVGGVGAGLLSGMGSRDVLRSLGQGAAGIAPAIPLILMAASVKHIVSSGSVIDTILYAASESFAGASPLVATLGILLLTLVIEFFIGSSSAKAFLLMPILLPLADLLGVTRQATVLAYCFGDGFSNLFYPTNPVLLISLGLTVVSYPQWIRWSLKLWLWMLVASLAFLAIAVAVSYGPF